MGGKLRDGGGGQGRGAGGQEQSGKGTGPESPLVGKPVWVRLELGWGGEAPSGSCGSERAEAGVCCQGG